MYCSQCGKEIADDSKFCNECGCPVSKQNEQQVVKKEVVKNASPKKNKETPKKIKLWHIIVVAAAVITIIVSYIVLPKVFSRYEWSEVKLSSVLPEPESKWGDLSSNEKDYLYLYVHRISLDEYNSYVAACVDKGFNIESETEDSSYIAFNTDGYKLSLYYYESDKKMTINVDAPMEMKTIQWATSNIASLLPTPASTLGYIERNDEKGFSIYLGKTSFSEYNTYVSECESKGFTVDFQKQEKSFSAKNSDGYQLNVQYIGCNVIYISIIEPQRTLDLSFCSIGSEFEFSVYIDDSWELDVEIGQTKTCNVVLGMGEHTIKVRSDDDWDMYDNYVLTVSKDEKIDFDVNCTQKGIKIDLSGELNIKYEKEDVATQSETPEKNNSSESTSNSKLITAKKAKSVVEELLEEDLEASIKITKLYFNEENQGCYVEFKANNTADAAAVHLSTGKIDYKSEFNYYSEEAKRLRVQTPINEQKLHECNQKILNSSYAEWSFSITVIENDRDASKNGWEKIK